MGISGGGGGLQGEGQKEFQAGSTVTVEPDVGLSLMTQIVTWAEIESDTYLIEPLRHL